MNPGRLDPEMLEPIAYVVVGSGVTATLEILASAMPVKRRAVVIIAMALIAFYVLLLIRKRQEGQG